MLHRLRWGNPGWEPQQHRPQPWPEGTHPHVVGAVSTAGPKANNCAVGHSEALEAVGLQRCPPSQHSPAPRAPPGLETQRRGDQDPPPPEPPPQGRDGSSSPPGTAWHERVSQRGHQPHRKRKLSVERGTAPPPPVSPLSPRCPRGSSCSASPASSSEMGPAREAPRRRKVLPTVRDQQARETENTFSPL